jgi:hypothetical protein
VDRGWREVASTRRAEFGHPRTQRGPVELPNGTAPKAGRTCVRKNWASRARVLSRRCVTVGHQRSHHSPTVMRPWRSGERGAYRPLEKSGSDALDLTQVPRLFGRAAA